MPTTMFSKIMWNQVTLNDSFPSSQSVLSPASWRFVVSGFRMWAFSASVRFGAAGLKLRRAAP